VTPQSLKKKVVLGVLLAALPLAAQTLPGMEQLTTHPADDYDAAVSPDGRWLAFVSTRSGNPDIWVKPLPRGRAVQITSHRSAESQPVWKPNGKVLVFVSARRDVEGDLWRVVFNAKTGRASGKPRQLTVHLGVDRDPAYAPDGKTLYFSSDRSGALALWRRTHGSGRMTRLGPGSHPALSPDGRWLAFSDRDSRLRTTGLEPPRFPASTGKALAALDGPAAWAPDGRSLLAVRIDTDSDGDGAVTPADRGALWQMAVYPEGRLGPGVRISSGLSNESHPAIMDSTRWVFTAGEPGARDLWTLPLAGLFPRQETAAQQYQMAVNQSGLWTTDQGFEQALLGYRRVLDYFPEARQWTGKARLQSAEIYRLTGRPGIAAELLDTLIAGHSSDALTVQRARLKRASLTGTPEHRRMALCREVITSGVSPRLVAEAWLVLGDLLRDQGDENAAFSAYEAAEAQLSPHDNLWARARLNLGDFWRDAGEMEAAQQDYLSVLNRFEHSPLWRERAGQRLWALLPNEVGARVLAIQRVADRPEATPAVAAMATLETAAVLMQAGRPDQAQRELEGLSVDADAPEWARLEAQFKLARVLETSDQGDAAIDLLEDLSGEAGALTTDPSVLLARERLFVSYLASARRLMGVEDYRLAASRMRKAVALKPRHIEARRLWIESAYKGGQVQSVIRRLEAAIDGDSENAVLLYSLGLAYSYLGERQPGHLETSNRLLQRALAQDYTLVHPYRTLSYNYEGMERRTEEAARIRPGFLRRVGHAVIGPLRWLYGLLPWTEEAVAPAYYELAIDALTTAIALNDEVSDPVMEAALAQNLANNFYNLGEFGFSKAYQYYRVRLALDSTFTQPLQEAVIHERAGRCAMYLEEHAVAGDYLRRAVSVYTRINRPASALQNRRRLAFLYHLSGNYEQAIAAYLKLVREDEAARRWNDAEVGLRNIAFNYHLLGEPEDALQYGYRAAEILERSPIPLKASPTSKLRIEILGLSIPVWGLEEIGGASSEGLTKADEAALVYGLIGRSAEALKDFDTASGYEEKRLVIARGRKDRLAERISLNRLGRLRFDQRQYAAAWLNFSEVRRLAIDKKDEQGRYVAAQNLAETAMALHASGRFGPEIDLALKWLANDMKPLEKTVGTEARQLLLHDLMARLYTVAGPMSSQASLGGVLRSEMHRLSRFSEAETHWRQALALAELLEDQKTMLRVQMGLAEVSTALGDWAAAQLLIERCRKLLADSGETGIAWRLALIEARLARASGDGRVAQSYKAAIDALQLAPVQPERSEERLSDHRARRDVYIEAAEVRAEAGEGRAALQLLELGRQQWASDMIARHPPVWKRERHKILWGNLSYARARLQALEKTLQQARRNKASYREIRDLEAEQARFRAEINELSTEFQKEDAVLAFLAGVYLPDLAAFQKTLRAGEGALVFMSGESATWVWQVGKTSVALVHLPQGEVHWARRAETLETAMLNRGPAADSLLQILHAELLQHSSDFLDGLSRVLIIPDGALNRLPFCAMGGGKNALLDRVTVLYAGSLTEYTLAWQRRKIRGRSVVAAGARTDRWLDHIDAATRLSGPESATETAVKAALSGSDRLHLGRWRRPAPADPLSSALLLYPDAENDGYLRTSELFTHDAATGLIVLPAERPFQSGGWLNTTALSRALLYVRVPTVVTPQWPVPPHAQSLWTQAFYQALETLPVDEALAEAQWRVRETASHPADWAGFRLWGYGGLYPRETANFARSNMAFKVRRGRAFEQEKAYAEALLQYREALGMAQVLADSVLMRRIHGERLRAAVNGKIWGRAAEIQETLLHWVQPADHSVYERSIKNLLAFHQRAGSYGQAAAAQKILLELHRAQGAEAVGGDLERLAMIHGQARNWPEALRWAEEACQYQVEAGNALAHGRALLRKGRLALEAERFWTARDALSEGLMLIWMNGEMGSDPLNFEIASGHQLLGLTEERLTRYEEARRHQLESRKLFSRLGQPLQAAQADQYLANLEWKEGRYREALMRQQRAMGVFDSLGAGKQKAMAYTTLGLIHMGLGDHLKAKTLMTEALVLAAEAGERADQAAIEKNLGLLALSQKAFVTAAQHFAAASAVDSALGSQRGLAYDLRHLGMLDQQYGRLAQSRSRLSRALALSLAVSDRRNAAQCYLGLGMLGAPETAIATLDTALVMTEEMDVPEIRWRLLRQRARRHEEAAHLDMAGRDYAAALEIIEAMRQTLGAESFKQGFLDDKMSVYEAYVALLIHSGEAGRALHVVERAKSRGLVDLLGNTAMAMHSKDSTAAQSLQRAEADVREAQSRLGEWAGRQDLSPDESRLQTEWKAALNQRRTAYLSAKTALEASNAELASLVAVDPLSSEEIQGLLPDSTAMLLYHVGKAELKIWAVTARHVTATTVSIPDTLLAATIGSFREQLKLRLSSDREARQLWNWLVAPVASELAGTRHWVVVPHGVLHYCPFGGLMGDDNQYLIEKVSVSLAPSATVLSFCMDKGMPVDAWVDSTSVLAFANPQTDAVDLPFADKEVMALMRSFDRTDSLSGSSVTERSVHERSENYGILHFACHGEYEAASPLFSALLLTPKDGDDGRLEAREIFGLRLKSQLVTLSACETGLSQVTTGDEIIGLARGFIYAGAPALVTSLWKVDDLATAVMMKRFYRGLRLGRSRAEALRQAQLGVMQNMGRDPALWAAFSVTGDFR